MLQIKPDTVTRLIAKLEEAGYIRIDIDPARTNTDRRRIYLTAAPYDFSVGIGKKSDTVPEKNPRPIENRDIKNLPPISPKGERRGRREPKEQAEWKPERFEGLWKFYPLHKSKQTAYKAWDTLRPSDELIAVIGKALRRQKAEENWQRGIGIPYLSTYLNQRRWEDEPYEPPGHDASGGWAESKEVIA